MTRKATNFDEARKGTSPSAAEQAARAGLEARLDRPLSDDEWKRQSQRLREFVKIPRQMGRRAARRREMREDGFEGMGGLRSTHDMQQNESPTTNRQSVLIYARVSSKEQEVEGYSIPAQLELLRGFASTQGMRVLHEFVDVESASARGRTGFGEMVGFLKKNRSRCNTILVEKTDRLSRNLFDYATLDELGPTIYFVKDGTILSPDSKSSEQFIHGIKVLMARNYSQNLGEETLKGMLQKAKSGLYPSAAPAGYRNNRGSGPAAPHRARRRCTNDYAPV